MREVKGLVVFTSKSCSPCRILKSKLEEANVEYTAVDVTEEGNEHYKFKYNIRSVPYVGYLNEDSKLVWSLLGDRATVENIQDKLSGK